MMNRFNINADLDNNGDSSTVSIKETRSGPMPRMSHLGIRSTKLSKQLSTNLLMKNALFHSDNLACMNYLLRHGFENKINLVYIDPPFLSGERYFRGGGLPWAGLVISAAVSASLIYLASTNLARRDF